MVVENHGMRMAGGPAALVKATVFMTEERARNKTKHVAIFEFVHAAILGGQYKVGQRIPSEAQLSRRFNTTRVTVAKALRELERGGLLDRRPGSGSYVRLPTQTTSRLLGLLVSGLGEGEVFEPFCSAIAAAVRSHQFTVLWGHPTSTGPEDKCHQAVQLCQQFIDQKVDGVFFHPMELVPGMEKVNHAITNLLDRAGVPVVLLDCDAVKYPQRSRYDLVGIDNRRAGYVLAEHLLALGAKRIDFVYRPFSGTTLDSRLAGCQEALLRHGIIPKSDWVRCGEPCDIEFVRKIVAQGPPDAFVCGNDYTAACLMQNLLSLGIRIPEEVRIGGFDDLKYASLLSIPLTTIHQPCSAMGVAAVDAMIRRIENPTMPARDILVDFHLVARESSVGKPPVS
jgi:DNA-binding LacI/PurR family transcriptional regulator